MNTLRMAPLDPDESRCERRILELICGSHGAVDATVACRVELRLTSRKRTASAILTEVAGSSITVQSEERWPVSTQVVVEIVEDGDAQGLSVRGVVRHVAGNRVSVALTERRHDGGEDRLRSFLLEAIRRRDVP